MEEELYAQLREFYKVPIYRGAVVVKEDRQLGRVGGIVAQSTRPDYRAMDRGLDSCAMEDEPRLLVEVYHDYRVGEGRYDLISPMMLYYVRPEEYKRLTPRYWYRRFQGPHPLELLDFSVVYKRFQPSGFPTLKFPVPRC